MFKVVKFQKRHLEYYVEEETNAHLKDWIPTGKAELWAAPDAEAYTCLIDDVPMVSCGFTKYWEGRAHIWAIYSEKSAPHFVAVFRGINRFLNQIHYRRIEMDVPLNMPYTGLAHRRAVLLGFTMECPYAKAYRPNGGDSALYSWTKGGASVFK